MAGTSSLGTTVKIFLADGTPGWVARRRKVELDGIGDDVFAGSIS
jgi:hypothetical protein